MKGLNKVMLVGLVGHSPELKHSATGGTPWCVLSVATHRTRKREGEWVEHTDWHRVKVFGTQAESCARRLRPGATVAVDGSLSYDKWADDDGNSHSVTSILADRITFMSDFGTARNRAQHQAMSA